MTIVDKVLKILGKTNKKDINDDIFLNPEKYYLRLESLSFIMVVRKEDNKYINVYDTEDKLKQMVKLLKKHPSMEE